jgi:ABC-type tungstate transport system permease subunit
VGEGAYVAPRARKHGIDDQDMLHALAQPLRVFDVDDGFTMLVRADTAGRLLEVGVVEGDTALVIVHAMPARQKFLR